MVRILQTAIFRIKYGGALQVATDLSVGLASKGHKVSLWKSASMKRAQLISEATKEGMLDGVEIVVFKSIKIFGKIFSLDLIRHCKNRLGHYDIIHINGYRNFFSVVVTYHARKKDVPYIICDHGTLYNMVKISGIKKFVLKKIFDFFVGKHILLGAERAVAISEAGVQNYLKFGVPKKKIKVIYNCLDLKKFHKIPKKGNFRKKNSIGEAPLILYLGILNKRKGIDFLIRAFSKLRTNLQANLAIVGPNDGYEPELKSLTRKLKLADQIKFIGPLGGNEKLEALVDADIVVYTAFFEDFGLVPFESILCGTPVIVSKNTGCDLILKKAKAGYSVPYGDVNALRELILYVLGNPEEAREKVENGKIFIRNNLTPQVIATAWEELYNEVIEHNLKT